MESQYVGFVASKHIAADNTEYNVVKVRTPENTNYRLFVPQDSLKLEVKQKVKITIEAVS